jgi:NADPH-dependent 2,4-dienoyl-CoA reductase/sulfur reductase-like enzyme/bacterioferritin-associated ferredoxin/Pyruvate/2-oxoacid:ferredoxin oxidoreductase delta subunit
VRFFFNGAQHLGIEGEMVSSAVFAAGERVFGHHSKDGSPQGLFCANGQCSQCTLVIDGEARKSCITPLRAGMRIETLEGLPEPPGEPAAFFPPPVRMDTDALVIGAGPAGMAAADEMGAAGLSVVVVDDKDRPGGKLVLQTHKFFGSVADCHAGTRGIRIAGMLAESLESRSSVSLWLGATVLAVFSDGVVGVQRPDGYFMVKPRKLLVAAGAREKSLPFPGCTLPGVYGAGAFQTLVNRDLVRCSERIFILGGGNVGLIGAYHALQAGMNVVGIAEGASRCGGYKVHADKIRRMGVPIYTSHSVLAAHGGERLEAVTICGVYSSFKFIPGTESSFAVDTLLVAVGLNPVDEFHHKALEFGMDSRLAGDAEEIAEASAAMFGGRIRGREIACELAAGTLSCPVDWSDKAEVLKSPGGRVLPYSPPEIRTGVFPVLHCTQEIPCNPCMTSCPKGLITTGGHEILGIPEYSDGCIGCRKCVAVCPGLAVTLVDYRKDAAHPTVTVPWEFHDHLAPAGAEMTVTDWEGVILGTGEVISVGPAPGFPGTRLLDVRVSGEIANRVAGVMVQDPSVTVPLEKPLEAIPPDEAVVCRCERVTAGEIRALIQSGVRDMNQLKALTRAGFGACGGKTCKALIRSIIRSEGVDPGEITDFTERPLFAEVELGFFAGSGEEKQ